MKIIAFDTEFDRRRTYRPTLSIIQIMDQAGKFYLFDCYKGLTEEDKELARGLLFDKDTIKVVHSGSQDMECLYYYFNEIPKNIFDTQVAARYLNFGCNQVGYDVLLKSALNVEIDKALQKSNWLRRPLSEEQIAYAKEDVAHLIDLYLFFQNNINKHDMQEAKRDSELLSDESLYRFISTNFWNKSKYNRLRVSKDKLEKMRRIFIWREDFAFKRNIPRQFILSNKEIIDFISEDLDFNKASSGILKYRDRIIDLTS